MSDLDRDLTKQPVDVPVLGTDTGTYTSPGDGWDATPVRSRLGEGEEESGLVPGTHLAAEVLNDLLGRLGEAIASVIDAPAISWTEPVLTAGDDPEFAGFGNGVFCGPLLVPTQWTDGGQALGVVNASGFWISYDGRRWEEQGALGLLGTPEEMAAGYHAGDEAVRLVVYASESGTLQFRYSDGLGASWADGGNLPAAPGDSNHIKLGFFDDKFYLVSRGNSGGDVTIAYSADVTADVNWTAVDTSAFWDANDPTAFVANGSEALIAIDGAPYIVRTANGTTWAPANSGLTDGVAYLAWSESRQEWIAVTTDGTLWTASEGAGLWTSHGALAQDLTGNSIGNVQAIACLGRVTVVSAGDWLWASRDLARWARLSPQPDPNGTSSAWEYLLSFNGGLWAAHRSVPSGGSGVTFESTRSGVLAPELARLSLW